MWTSYLLCIVVLIAVPVRCRRGCHRCHNSGSKEEDKPKYSDPPKFKVILDEIKVADGWRIATYADVKTWKYAVQKVLSTPWIDPWIICKLADGSIAGSGYGYDLKSGGHDRGYHQKLVVEKNLGLCPTSHPYAYHSGKFCCATSKEKIYEKEGASCDGGKIGLGSSCCENDNYTPCPYRVCANNDKCPHSFPYAYFNGKFCCATSKEKVSEEDGALCDGGKIGISSLCCENDKYTPCPHGVCANYGKCPTTHPYAYHSGKFCCATSKEKISEQDGASCDGGRIGLSSSCCENDNYTPCPYGVCEP